MKNLLVFLISILFLLLQKLTFCSIRCSKCHKEISHINSVFNIKSPIAINFRRKKLFNKPLVLAQVFSTPMSIQRIVSVSDQNYIPYYEIITAHKTSLFCSSEVNQTDSFFIGYGWSICNCLYCAQHQGFKFTPIESHCEKIGIVSEEERYACERRTPFYGMILTHLESGEKVEEKVDF